MNFKRFDHVTILLGVGDCLLYLQFWLI